MRVTGIAKQAHHPPDCSCEDCGPAFMLVLSQYEAERLLDHLRRTADQASGDYHGQMIFKLCAVLEVPWS